MPMIHVNIEVILYRITAVSIFEPTFTGSAACSGKLSGRPAPARRTMSLPSSSRIPQSLLRFAYRSLEKSVAHLPAMRRKGRLIGL